MPNPESSWDGVSPMEIDGDQQQEEVVEEVERNRSSSSSTTEARIEETKMKTEKERLWCIKCMEPWTSQGDHQVCCLPCGHLYGLACINRWILERGRKSMCPQCNTLCRQTDVRKLYASPVYIDDEDCSTFLQKVGSLSLKAESTPVQFGSSASAPTFGSIGTTFGSSPFVSSTPASTSSVFGSSWQPGKSSLFGSTSNSTAPTVFSFGASPASVAAPNNTSTGSLFSFTMSAANVSSTTSQPVFGIPNPAFKFGLASGNNDQMSMENTMAEDTVQASTPSVPNFGQPPISSPSSGFMFNSITPSGANSFQFGGQQNTATLKSPTQATLGLNLFQFGNQQSSAAAPFQASSSLDFNAGGSFSLGTGAGDKSNRKMVKVKRTARKK